MIGDVIGGKYRCLRVLGEGGMGAVYEAEHLGTGRRVAVKVIHGEMAQKSEMVARFQREARAAGAIETSHIVQVIDTGTDPDSGVIYMVMELLRGEDLKDLFHRLGPLPQNLAIRLVGQACVGLAKAHATSVVHRDIKPANLFLSHLDTGSVIVKVVDFGIAKIMVEPGEGEEAQLTRTGGMLGSPVYMSPEQATGKKSIDHRTDIWSMGVVFYQALTGKLPYQESSLGALLLAICSQHAPPVQDLAPWVSPGLAELVHAMLVHDPAQRFQSMQQVLDAIRAIAPAPLTVDASELVGLSAEERATVAPRSRFFGGPAAAPIQAPSAPGFAASQAGGVTGAVGAQSLATSGVGLITGGSPAAVTTATGAVSTVNVVAPPPPPPLAPPSRSKWMVPAALVVGVGLAAVAFRVAGGGSAPAAAPPAPSALASAPAIAATASATPASTVVVVAPPQEEAMRVGVDPPDATVEVDGRPAPVTDGSVEVRGVIGSAHHLKIVKDGRETSVEVAITSRGPVPPKVKADPAAPVAAPKPAGAAKPKPAPGKRDEVLNGKFE
jgi:serine/threonine-protein kinase